ncbi:MAG: hypothetical protein ABIZ91_19320, partial [Gemmatimonadaceae bacterium]
MRRAPILATLAGVLALGAPLSAVGQQVQVGIIDFYGIERLPAARLREALTFREGDTLFMAGGARPAMLADSERRLAAVPGVLGARASVVCCEQGAAMVYIGIRERGAAELVFSPAPAGDEQLAADVVVAGAAFQQALLAAVRRAEVEEDRSQGHALARDSATRAIQEQFIVLARRDLPGLRGVLHHSASGAQRALAVQLLGYAP